MHWIKADWPAPAMVHAGTSTRGGGFSPAPYDSLNIATHVGDDNKIVCRNRAALCNSLALPMQPCWLKQTHSTKVINAADYNSGDEADGCIATNKRAVCVVMTADCLPLLLCDKEATAVAALHTGWRGLINGIIESGVALFEKPGDSILAWLGPAIGPQAFEVGEDVFQAFVRQDSETEACFQPLSPKKWLVDLYALARRRLQNLGIDAVYGGSFCTYSDPVRFYSYRRDGQCGRMASLIWLDD